MPNKYKQYADLKTEIARLTDEAKVLEAEIFNEVSEIEGCKLETEFATFSLMFRPKWEYSDELKDREALAKLKLKQMKADEERTGVAKKVSDGGFLRCQIKR